ncbi:hypothetical protein AGABI2DRAFT_186654 [Agaricus bisporus var. bisporus H97]|uniref:hypothetical protein n=1 Tax=Agaricus bisporus var. bisporus (strain H97 / ATCC MYA-4626 / FGSC 10389) TaxID=936046 RepID=UPI00029F5677|nr:hypothetical protein AGABI2DRAFT_186654 [Agaricus bisporus var. bisporus H97]EKV45971.1 hypothetical protein AGABI2DRAFT_186654 [Agaricus bisporus var. bisporus H97]
MAEGSIGKGSPDATSTPAEGDSDYMDQDIEYPNWWAKHRMIIREAAAEFLGTAILIIFGTGVDCQAVLSMNTDVAAFPRGSWLSLSFGWAVGVAVGVWVSGGISGGHINPAVTLSLAVFRGFPWKKVPIYMMAQLLGALVGSALIYANYFHAIDIYEGGRGIRTQATASLFSTYALDYMTNVSAFFSEYLTSAVLMISILAFTDPHNMAAPSGLLPLALFILILGIGVALGMETGYAINPARDFGPRIMTAMVGYGKHVFTFRNQYWLWCPIIAPFLGCLSGALLYDVFLFTGKESPINKPSKSRSRNTAIAADKA